MDIPLLDRKAFRFEVSISLLAVYECFFVIFFLFPFSVPSLLENEEGQVQFIISWVKGPKLDSSTWFAIDVRPEDILNQAKKILKG